MLPIDSMLSGIVTETSELQYEKQLSLIFVILFGIFIFVRDAQLLNAAFFSDIIFNPGSSFSKSNAVIVLSIISKSKTSFSYLRKY